MKSKYALNPQQRYALILECRNSGLTDYQWCKEHGIHPGTFYNWVSKLKKKGITDIPEPCGRETIQVINKQEVVKLQIDEIDNTVVSNRVGEINSLASASAISVEIEFNGAIIKISNTIDCSLLKSILSVIGGASC